MIKYQYSAILHILFIFLTAYLKTATAQCGQTDFTELSSVVESPTFGVAAAYPDNSNCIFSVTTPRPESTVTITFTALDIEFEGSCGYDSLEIKWEIPPMSGQPAKLCGNTVPETALLGNGNFKATFISDASAGGAGFQFTYDVQSFCNPDPCENNSGCVENLELEIPECDCSTGDSGYEGEFCELEIDECLSTPCEHNGVCTDSLADYSCECLPGFEGNNCEIVLDPCASEPCLFDGECLKLSPTIYKCECLPGYSGGNCEIEANPCDLAPCLNEGRCVKISVLVFQCECPEGYSGDTCEISPLNVPLVMVGIALPIVCLAAGYYYYQQKKSGDLDSFSTMGKKKRPDSKNSSRSSSRRGSKSGGSGKSKDKKGRGRSRRKKVNSSEDSESDSETSKSRSRSSSPRKGKHKTRKRYDSEDSTGSDDFRRKSKKTNRKKSKKHKNQRISKHSRPNSRNKNQSAPELSGSELNARIKNVRMKLPNTGTSLDNVDIGSDTRYNDRYYDHKTKNEARIESKHFPIGANTTSMNDVPLPGLKELGPAPNAADLINIYKIYKQYKTKNHPIHMSIPNNKVDVLGNQNLGAGKYQRGDPNGKYDNENEKSVVPYRAENRYARGRRPVLNADEELPIVGMLTFMNTCTQPFSSTNFQLFVSRERELQYLRKRVESTEGQLYQAKQESSYWRTLNLNGRSRRNDSRPKIETVDSSMI